jgi:hypothetical protein
MTDRLYGCVVAFERDIREDDAEPLLAAIRMLRGVLSVTPHVADHAAWMAEERAHYRMRQVLIDALNKERKT